MDLGLRNKVAVVLAASRGMGRASAMALAAEGCQVALCARGEDALREAARDIREKTGQPVLTRALDVEKSDLIAPFLDHVVRELGTVHILVTNGGGPTPGPGLSMPEGEWLKAAQSTLLVPIQWTRAVAPIMMKQKWGRILHIQSSSILQPIDGLILSNTMRAGVAGFAKTMSRELAPHGILVNVLCPGSTKTDRLHHLAERRAKDSDTTVEEQFQRLASEVPLGRIGTPEEFAHVVAFLASERASFITGALIPVDGGVTRGW